MEAMTTHTPITARGISYRTQAYWYAVGYNDSLRRHADAPEAVDSFEFGYHAARLADKYERGDSTHLLCIPDMFMAYLGGAR